MRRARSSRSNNSFCWSNNPLVVRSSRGPTSSSFSICWWTSSCNSAWRTTIASFGRSGMTRAGSAARSPLANSTRAVAGVCFFVCLAIAAAQYLAGYFLLWSFHLPPLGATPLTVARYLHFYGDNSHVRRRVIICSALGLGVVGASVGLAFRPKPRPLHGEARFATRREIARAGLFSDHGIILGQYGSRYLVLPGQQGVAVAAPPRAGKGTGIVIPNLLHWPGSVVCVDVK